MSDIFDTLTIEKPKRDIFDTLGEPEGDIFDKISPPSFFQKAKETISTFAGDVSEGYKQIFDAKTAPAEIPEIQKLQGESTLGLTHPEQAKAGRMFRSDKALQERLSKISVAMQAQPDFYKGMTPESVLERQTELEKTGTGEVQPSNIDPVEWAAFIVGGGIPGVVKAGLAAGVRAAASQAIKTGLEAAAMGLAQIPIGIATEEIAATGYGKTHPEVATAFNFLANAATLYGLNKALTKLQKTDTWRKMEIRERGLVTQTIEQMKQAQPYGKFKGFTEGEVARMSPEAYKESLAKRMPAESAESSSMKISKALGKENQPAILEKMGIMTEEAKVGQIVNDAVTQKLSAAKAFEAKGKTDLARQAKEEALKNAETIRVADGPTADKAVTEALKKTEKPISAITSEPMETTKGKYLFQGGPLLDISKIGEEGISLTDSRATAKQFSKLWGRSGNINKIILSSDAKVMRFNDIPKEFIEKSKTLGLLPKNDTYKEIISYAKEKGFDAVDLRKFGENEIRVLNPKVIEKPISATTPEPIKTESLPEEKEPAYNKSHLEFIRDRVIAAEPPKRTGVGEETKTAGGYPEWFRNKGYTRIQIIKVVNNALEGKKLNPKQSDALDDLMQSSLKEYEGMGKEIIYPADLAEGQKVVINGEEFTKQGDILQDGEPVEIDPFEKIKVDKVLPAEGKPAIKPEEVKERFVLEPTEPTEAKIKPTQPDMLGITPEVMEGKIPSVELPETALEQATRGAQTRKVEAEMAKKQVGLGENKYLYHINTSDLPMSEILKGKSRRPDKMIYTQEGKPHTGDPNKEIIVIDPSKLEIPPEWIDETRKKAGEYLVRSDKINPDAIVGIYKNQYEMKKALSAFEMHGKEEAPTVKETEAELGEKINEAIGEVIPPVGLGIKKVGAQPGKGITDFKFENPDIETRWKSSYGIRKESLRQRGRESLQILWHKMSRGTYEHIPRSKEFSQLRFDLLKLAKQKGVSADRTLRNIQGITLNFNRIDRNLFDRKVILEDLAETIEQGKEIPFGFNKESITKELNRLSTEITKNPHIQQALEAREKVWSVLKDEYIKTMEDVGFDVSEKLANKNYFRHQVLDYVKAQGLFGTGAKLKTPVARGFLRKRMGSELDINTDYIQAEYEVMSQMMYDIEIAKTIKMIDKKYNIASKLKKDEPIPEGYTVWQPREGNVFYMADTIPAKLANQLTEGLVEEIGVKATDLNKALAMGGKRKEFVVKEEIALTLNNLVRNKDVSRLMDIDKKALKGWKVWQLISPRRFFKYNIRNLTGDAEGSFLGNPSGFRKTPQAFKELYEVLYGDKSMSPDMKDWFERGGMQTTLQVQEMGELNKLRIFQKQYEIKTGIKDIPEKTWSKYWKNVRLATDFRESILRYANYLDFLEQMKNNPDGLPKSFGASLKEEIIGLSDIEDRAFKMSNELLGAYDDISIIGQALREHLFPFWSWKEINMKRYYRLAKNAVHEGNIAKIAGRQALRGVATTPYKAYKIGKFILKATAFFAGLQAYNHLFFPKEERELDEKTRARPHIILGRNKEGKIITFTRIGILGDLLEWFGLDIAPQYVDKWFRDRMSLGEIAKNMAKSPINVLVQGSTPYFKTPAELLSQKKLFPDFSKPVRIRDNGLYLAESLGLGNEYKALSRMPSKPYLKSIPSIFYYEIDTGEAAYSNIYEEKRRFLKEIGKERTIFVESKVSDALYNMRLAIRYKDDTAAKDYFLEYRKYGGTREGIVKSLQNMSPVSSLTEAEASAFIIWLDEEGKQNLVKALKFYDNVLLGNQKEE